MKLTDELNAEQKALGAFLAAMKDCHLDGAKMRKAMIDVLGLADSDKQATLGAVPDGWVLVPVEPTEDMLNAATENYKHPERWHTERANVYKRMVAAAPRQGIRESGS